MIFNRKTRSNKCKWLSQSQGQVFLILVLTLIFIPWMAFDASGQTGYWELTAEQPIVIDNPPVSCNYGEGTIRSGYAEITTNVPAVCDGANRVTNGTFGYEFFWTPPPQTLNPHEIAQLNLKVVAKSDTVGTSSDGVIELTYGIHLSGNRPTAGQVTVPAGSPIPEEMVVDVEGFETIPGITQQFAVYVQVFQNSSYSGGITGMEYRYIYDWVSGSTTTPPPPGQNRAPSVSLTYTPATVTPSDILTLFADAFDPDGDTLTYSWYVNGTHQPNVVTNQVKWDNPRAGTHTIRVMVSDGKGGTAEASVTISIGDSTTPPPPSTGTSPCEINFMTLNPNTEIAGPLLTPGNYMVWTSVAGSNRTFSDWQSYGPFEFKPGHEYTIVMDQDTDDDGEVVVFKQDNGMLEASAYYVNESFNMEFAITVCPVAAPPPPPSPPTGTSPCEIQFMTLKPNTEITGPLLTPGNYMVWTSTAGPNRTFNNWQSVGPYEFRSGHDYMIIMDEETARNGRVDMLTLDNGMLEASAYYINEANSIEFAVTVCPQGPVGAPPGGDTIEISLDSNGNDVMDDTEIRQAIQYWILGQTVPGTNQTISDAKIRELIQKWILGEPLSVASVAVAKNHLPRFTLKAMHPQLWELIFNTPDIQEMEVCIYDLNGQMVAREYTPGRHLSFNLNADHGKVLANGTYLYVIRTVSLSGTQWQSDVKKLAILR